MECWVTKIQNSDLLFIQIDRRAEIICFELNILCKYDPSSDVVNASLTQNRPAKLLEHSNRIEKYKGETSTGIKMTSVFRLVQTELLTIAENNFYF